MPTAHVQNNRGRTVAARSDPALIPRASRGGDWRGGGGDFPLFSGPKIPVNHRQKPPKTSKSLTTPLNFADGGDGGGGGVKNV